MEKTHMLRSLIVTAALASSGGAALGQGIEVDDIRADAEAAREGATEEAQAFAERVLQLAEEQKDAASEMTGSLDRLGEGLEMANDILGLSGEEIEALAGRGAPGEAGPVLYVMVSLGMPDQAIRDIVEEAGPLGGSVVIRGFYGGSFSATQARILEIFEEGDAHGFMIDPRPFQAFGVTEVPTFVVAESAVEPCGGIGCVPEAPPHDLIRGNISIAAALRAMGLTQ